MNWAASCDGKQSHETRHQAEAQIRSLIQNKHEENLQAYRCILCGHWHCGHIPKGEQK